MLSSPFASSLRPQGAIGALQSPDYKGRCFSRRQGIRSVPPLTSARAAAVLSRLVAGRVSLMLGAPCRGVILSTAEPSQADAAAPPLVARRSYGGWAAAAVAVL